MACVVRCFVVCCAAFLFVTFARGEYITRIWLTHANADTATLMVNWETDLPGPSRVAYGPTEALGGEVRVDAPVTLHHVPVPFPDDGALYYRVSTDRRCSAIHAVQTYSGNALRIAAAANWQDHPDLGALLAERPHLLLSCGDLINGLMSLGHPGNRSITTDFSDLIDAYPALFARTPFMPVLGNHDRQIYHRLLQPPPEPIYDLKATAFLNFFPLPEPGRTWHLDIPGFDVRVIGLDLSHTPDAGTTWQSCQAFDTGSAQMKWYRETMAASRQRFVLTVYNEWHHLVGKLADGEWMNVARQGSAAISGFGLFAERADFEGLPCFNTALKTGDIYGNGGRTRFYQKSAGYLLLTIPKATGPMRAEFKTLEGKLMNRTAWPERKRLVGARTMGLAARGVSD